MRFCVLGSGSRGNCTYVEAGGTAVLIDAGFSGVEVERRLAAIGVTMAAVAAILVTHEHGDHIGGVAILSRRYRLPVFANAGTIRAAGKGLAKLHASREIVTGESFPIGPLQVHPFAISHDTADPVGYTVSFAGCALGYCTDTGMISRLIHRRLAACQGLVLECNHDPEMLKNGPYPLPLQQRVRSSSGHLANLQAGDFLAELLHERLEHVVLAHLSESNNRPELALATVTAMVAAAWGENGGGPAISLAWQDRVGEVVTLGGRDFSRSA